HLAEIIAVHDPDQLLHLQGSQGVNYAALARALQAHALWCLGYPQQAQERGLDAIKLVQDLDQPFNQALVSAYLALLQQWRAEEGLASINEALAEARVHNERWWEAEIHRLRGEFLLMHGVDASDGEAAILRAIAIARSQQARSLELRATMSLARLWIAQNRSTDARRRLRDMYSWFTEGFETPDLQAARLLLAQL